MAEHIADSSKAASCILRHADLQQALYDAVGDIFGRALVNLHGSEHRARRNVEAKIFRKDYFRYYERDVLARELDQSLAPYVTAGRADLVDVGYRVMLNLTADFAGIDRAARAGADTERLLQVLREFSLSPAASLSTLHDLSAVKQRIRNALREFHEHYLAPSISRRTELLAAVESGALPEAELPRDVLTILLQARDELELTDDELLQETAFFLLAGAHTSIHTLTHAMNEIFRWLEAHPNDRMRLENDPVFVQRCVHESLRLHPSSPVAKRRSPHAMHLENVGDIAQGDVLIAKLRTANRDPEVFGKDSESFCPVRATPAGTSAYGLSMGLGPHACLGRNLAVGMEPKGDVDPANHHYGTVPLIASALFRASARPDPDRAPTLDGTTERITFSSFPIVFVSASHREV